jgi:hypothetical protein
MRLLTCGNDNRISLPEKFRTFHRFRFSSSAFIDGALPHADHVKAAHSSSLRNDPDRRHEVFNFYPFLLRSTYLRFVCRHIAALTSIADGDGFSSQPDSRPRRINGGIAATDDDYIAPNIQLATAVNFLQHLQSAIYTLRIFTGNIEGDIPVRPGAQKDSLKTLINQIPDGVDRRACAYLYAGICNSLYFAVQDGTGKSEGIDSHPQYSSRFAMGLKYGYAETLPVEEVGGRKTGGTAADYSHSFRPSRFLSTRQPGSSLRHFTIGKKTFDAADGHCLVQRTAATGILAGVVADAPAYPRQGIVLPDDIKGFVESGGGS